MGVSVESLYVFNHGWKVSNSKLNDIQSSERSTDGKGGPECSPSGAEAVAQMPGAP